MLSIASGKIGKSREGIRLHNYTYNILLHFTLASFIEELARKVEDTADVYFVPAFSGLYAPHWEHDARGWVRPS